MSHGNTVDDEHCFSSPDGRSIEEEHPNFRGHATECVLNLKGSWEEHLPLVEFTYNNNYHASIHMAPYEALYGRPCRILVCWTEVRERPSIGPDLVKDTSKNEDFIWKHLLTAQSGQKSYVDRRRRPLKFEVGDHVFLKVMPKR